MAPSYPFLPERNHTQLGNLIRTGRGRRLLHAKKMKRLNPDRSTGQLPHDHPAHSPLFTDIHRCEHGGRRRTHGHHGRGRRGMHSGAPQDRLTGKRLEYGCAPSHVAWGGAQPYRHRNAERISWPQQSGGTSGLATYRERMLEAGASGPSRHAEGDRRTRRWSADFGDFPPFPAEYPQNPAEPFGMSPGAPGTVCKASTVQGT